MTIIKENKQFIALLPNFLRDGGQREESFMDITLQKARESGFCGFEFDETAMGDVVITGTKETKEDTEENIYKTAIIDRLDRQNNKGLEKYGSLLVDSTDIKMLERLEHLAEELTDGLNYIEHIKALNVDIEDSLIESIGILGLVISQITNDNHKEKLNRVIHELLKPILNLVAE